MTIPIGGLSALLPQLQSLQTQLPQQLKQLEGQINQQPGGGQPGRQIGLDIAGENGISMPLPPMAIGGPSFGDTLTKVLNQVSAAQDNAQDQVQKFLNGEPVELHQVMAATEEAGIATEMLVELRNKVTDAYRTIVNMQS